MKKTLRRYLAFAMAFAMLATYSFSPQNLTAFAFTGTDAQQVAEEPATGSDEPTKPEEPATEEEQTSDPEEEGTEATEPTTESEQEGTEEVIEEETDLLYPEVSFKERAAGMTVKIFAPEGALPEGATVKVTAVQAGDIEDAVEDLVKDGKVIKAVDITFYDKDGKEIEPEKKVSVSFESEKIGDLDNPAVIHINDEGDAERVSGSNVNTNTNKATFKTDEFSVYAIIEEGSEEEASARLKVIFKKGEEEIASTYVKKADTNDPDEFENILYDPGVGEVPDNAVFKGWTTKANYDSGDVDDALNIDGVRADVTDKLNGSFTDGDEVVYHAMMFRQFTVSYKDDTGASLGTDNVAIPVTSSSSSAEYTVNMGYTPHDADQGFEGWLVESGASNITSATYEGQSVNEPPYLNGTVLTITGNVVLSVNAPHGHWLVFKENGKGATYNAPQFVKAGDTTTRPRPDSEMVRNGYNFGGWYKDEACTAGNEFTFGGELTDNTTIYAKWNPIATANYTVIIWKQNVSGEGYDYAEHIQLTGNVGTTINTVRQQGTGDNAYVTVNGQTKRYTGFHLKEFDHNVEIVPEGNAVVNVYYDRTEYTLTFQNEDYVYTPTTGNGGTQYGYYNGEYVRIYRNGGTWYRTRTMSWGGYQYSDPYYGTRYTRSYNQSWQTIKTITALYEQDISANFPISGFEGYVWEPQNSSVFTGGDVPSLETMPAENTTFRAKEYGSGVTIHFYYYLETIDGSGAYNFDGKNFEEHQHVTISSSGGITSTKDEDFVDIGGFSQYGSDPAYGSDGRVSLNAGNNYTMRFYYERKNFDINYMDGSYFDGGGNPIEEPSREQLKVEDGISYGANLSSYNKGGSEYYEPTDPNGVYTFEGWYLDETCTQPYTFSSMTDGGITVYAKWRQREYRVFLHPNAGTDPSLDWGSETQAMSFRVSSGETVSAPSGLRDGYEFVGWYTDPDCTQLFNAGVTPLNESTVTTPYNKATDYTDTIDKWGNVNDPKSNSDARNNRFWITKKLDLYGKWRQTLDGANGIGIHYEANGGSNPPSDTAQYLDNSRATAGAAATPPANSNATFKYWVIQEWDDTNQVYNDTTKTVLAGSSFDVLKNDAKCVVSEWVNPHNPDDVLVIPEAERVPGTTPPDATHTKIKEAAYTVQLRAEYKVPDEAVPTHIPWYENDGTKAFHIDRGDSAAQSTLLINEGVDIQGPPTGAQGLDGYTFIGWAKVDMGDSLAAVEAFETTASNWTQDSLSEDDLFLYYDGSSFHIDGKNGRTVTQVAADEVRPYDALFAVWKKELKITVKKRTTEYNGSDQDGYVAESNITETGTAAATIDKDEYKIEGLRNGDVLTVEGYTPSTGKNVGEYTNGSFETATITITRNGRDVTKQYDIETIKGDLQITKPQITVTITGHHDTKDYDGTEHSVSGYDVVIPEGADFTEDDIVFDGTATAARTKAGTTNMGLTANKFSVDSPNFHVIFDVTDGYMTIDPIDVTVTITGHHDEKDYDGTEHSASGYDVEISNPLYTEADFSFSGNDVAKRTDAGTTNMGLAESQFTNTNENFRNVTFEVTDGYMTIKPIAVKITIVGANNSTDYDGADHTVTGYTATADNELYDPDEYLAFNGDAEATRKNAGTTYMGLEEDQFVNTNENFTNITFDITDGYQEIKPIEVTVNIVGKNHTDVYDGQEHTVTGYTATASSTLYDVDHDFTFSGTAVAKRTNEGTTNMNLSEDQFENTNENFTNVTFVITDGYQTITPIDEVVVTITGHNTVANYDGQPHTAVGYDVQISNPLYTTNDFTFDGPLAVARTDVGTSPMGLAEDQFENTNTNFDKVTFVITDGYVTINPINVTVKITGHNNTTDYDGAEHKVTGYDVQISNPLYTEADFEFTGTAEAARTDAGTTNMGLAQGQFENKNPNFGTVTFEVTDGYQTITPINVVVTIVGNNNSADYDGEAHTVTGYTATANSELYDVEHDFTFSGNAVATRTDAGTTNMGLAQSQFTNTNTNFGTVTFNITDGYQEIKPIDVVVTIVGKNNTTDYDGNEHTVTGYTATANNDLYNVETDFTFSGNDRATRTDVGTTNMGLAESQFTNTNTNFGTVTFNVTDGYQKIEPIDVTVKITGHNNTADYDGTEHSVSGYDVEISNPLYKEADFSFSGTATASRTEVGTTNMNLAASQFTNTNTNFGTVTFEVTDGYQKIKPISVTVTITGHNSTVDYDGAEHSVSGYDVEISNPLYTAADFTFSGTAEATRTDAGTSYMGLKENQFANTNTNFEDVTFVIVDGYQKIKTIDVVVTIVGANSTLPYDKTEHTVSGYTATANTELYDVEHDFRFSGTATASQTEVGTANMGLAASQFTNTNTNFGTVTFNITDGYQTITPIDVVVTIVGANNTTKYDGQEHSVSGYTATFSTNLYTEADFTFNGTATAARTEVGTNNMGLTPNMFENTNENFGTVTFNITDGYQTITPVDKIVVTITGHNNTTAYDGEEHSVSGYEVSISDPLYKESDFTFTGTAAAARTDAGTTNMGLAQNQFVNNNPNFENVTFNVTDGYQTITPIDVVVTITGHNETVDYDGNQHFVSGYDVATSTPLYTEDDFDFSGTAGAARTPAGTTNMGLERSQFSNKNPNFETVTFNVTDGFITINPISVTVTIVGNNDSKPYDGEEHSVSGYEVTEISNDLFKETDIVFSGTAEAARTDAGKTNMGLLPKQFSTNNPNFTNVTFNVTDGYQEITPIDVIVTITGKNDSKPYDGAEHTVTGYTATANNTLYDVSKDFTFSGTAEASQTDVGKDYMGLVATQFTNTNTNFRTVTFNITDGYQEITPIDVIVTIVGNNNTAPYDGEEHNVSGYTATANTPLYDVTKDITFNGTASAVRTDAGTTPMGLADSQFTNKNPNFGTVTFNVTDGYQAITPIDVTVTITGHNNTTTYDGAEHSVSGYDVQISNPLFKEADIKFSGTAEAAQTDVGTDYMGLNKDQFSTENPNFGTVTFNVTDGYQTITPIDEIVVTITGHHNTTAYDGEEHSVSGYDVEISNPLYKEADIKFTGTAEAARTDAGTTNMGLADSQFENKNPNFKKVTFNVTDGYQTITPIDVAVTITGHNNTTDYDGEEHSVSGYDVEISNPLFKEADIKFSGTAEAAQTNVGTDYMGLNKDQFSTENPNFGTVTFNVIDGYQTITPIDVVVTIIGNNNTTDYDGEEHQVTGYTATANSDLYNVKTDFTFSGNDTATRTDVGTTNMGLAQSQFTNTNTNFGTVTFNVTDGYQTITPIDVTVTITGHNNTTDYDGTEHSVSGYDVEISNPLFKEADIKFSGTAEAAQTDVGTDYMGLNKDQFSTENPNFKKVTFNVIDGYQTIEPINVTVTITGHNNTTDYDGEEHSVSGYDVEISNPLYTAADFTFSGTAEAARTDAGTTPMGLAQSQFTNTNTNFGTVTFNITDGYQTINPINVTVTITGHNNTTTYDGEEHSVSGYDVEFSNDLYTEDDFEFSGTAEAARREAGTTDMGLEEDQFTNTNSNFANVTFVVTDGYQAITPVNEVVVTITGHNNTTDYDGTEHSVSGYDVQISNPLYKEKDFTFSGTAEAAQTNVGTDYMGLADSQFENTNPNFKKVTFNVTDGYQTITPINVTVTITGHYNTTDYDGEEHSVSGYDVAISNPLYTEADFTFSGTAEAARTDAGTTPMGLAQSQFKNTNKNFDTVTFNITDGYQTINPINVVVTITGKNNTTNYDGDEHKVTGYTATASTPLYDVEHDFTFSGTAEAARTNAGTTNMGLAEDQFTNTNENFANVTFNVTDGYQTINKINATVTIIGHNNTTDYDGEEHSVNGYDVEISTNLYKETDFTFNGTAEATRTDAGTTNMGLAQSQFTNNNQNFETVTFNVTDGYQTINPIDVTVTITGHYNTTDYDGAEHSVSGYDVSISDPLFKEADIIFNGTAEAARTDAGTTNMGLNEDQFSSNNPNFGTVTFNVTDGYQTIEPIDVTVTITGHTDTKVYDGTEHSVSGYDVSISDPLFTEDDIIFSSTAEAARTDAGTTNMGLNKDQFSSNNPNFGTVTFKVTDGAMTITPVDEVVVTITGHKNTTDYDGEEHSVSGYDVSISNPLYKASDFTFSGTAEAARTDAGTTNMGLNENQFTNTSENFKKVTFNVTDGYQKIEPIDVTVTITGHNNTTDYDGEEHSVSGYDVEISNPLYKEADFTFSGTAEAARTDAGTTNMGLAQSQFTNTNENFRTVTFDITDGYQTIEPIEVTVTITGHKNTTDYDGTEHTVSGYDVEISNPLFKKSDISFSGTASATRTDAGTTNMGLTPEQFSTTNPNFTNVTFNVTDGYQKIEPISATVTITGHTDSTVYDGEEHSTTGFDITIPEGSLYKASDIVFSGNAEASRTDAGTTNMGLEESQFSNSNPNFKDVTFNVTDGYQTIETRAVTVTIVGHHDTVVYDSKPHSVEGYDVKFDDPLFSKDDIEFSGNDEITETNQGTYYMGLESDQFENKNGNFDITFDIVDGYLTIAKAGEVIVTITGHHDTSKYNATEQSVSGYDVEISDPLYKESDFEFSGTAEAARTNKGTTDMGLAEDQFTNINENFEKVTFVVIDGYQKITPVKVVIKTGSATKTYDGTALTKHDASIKGLVGGDVSIVKVKATGSRIAVGKSTNTYSINWGSVDKDNYIISKSLGTLTVNPAPAPGPGPGPGPAPGPGNVVPAAPAGPATTIVDDPTPTTIIDDPTPKAVNSYWALINLLCAIATALLSLIMLIRYFGKRREEDEETGETTEIKRKGLARILSLIPAIGAIIAFILTEDMGDPWTWVDKWTILMVVILIIQIIVAIIAKKSKNEEDEEEAEAEAPAETY